MSTTQRPRTTARVTVENVNHPGSSSIVDASMYHAMREAMLEVLPSEAPGLTVAEMREAVLVHLSSDLFPGGARVGWWSKTVQLDLEAKGLITREISTPLRLHRNLGQGGRGSDRPTSAKRDWASAPPAEATAEIDARLAALPADKRATLQALRETIADAAPEAVETISYDLPAFRYHGRAMMAYLAARRHCSLFPMGPEVIEAEADQLAAFDTRKGTIRFTPDHPVPPDLVTRLVHARMAQIDAHRK